MQLSKKAIEEYKEIHKKKSGKDISDEEAYEQASNLIRVFEAIYSPIPKGQVNRFNKKLK